MFLIIIDAGLAEFRHMLISGATESMYSSHLSYNACMWMSIFKECTIGVWYYLAVDFQIVLAFRSHEYGICMMHRICPLYGQCWQCVYAIIALLDGLIKCIVICFFTYSLNGAQPWWSGYSAAPQSNVGVLMDAFAKLGLCEFILAHHRHARRSAFPISVGAHHHIHRFGFVCTFPRGCSVGLHIWWWISCMVANL